MAEKSKFQIAYERLNELELTRKLPKENSPEIIEVVGIAETWEDLFYLADNFSIIGDKEETAVLAKAKIFAEAGLTSVDFDHILYTLDAGVIDDPSELSDFLKELLKKRNK